MGNLVRFVLLPGQRYDTVGGPFLIQQLLRIDKAADGTITTRQLLPVRVLVAVALTSAAALAFEVLLIRVFSIT